MATAAIAKQVSSIFLTQDGSRVHHIGLVEGTLKLMESTATKVSRIVTSDGGLAWGEFPKEQALSLPLGQAEEIPEHYQGLIRIESEEVGKVKFIHTTDPSSVKNEIVLNVWPIVVNFHADSKREGKISTSATTNRWVWGGNGVGSVIMPNKDRDHKEPGAVSSFSELVPLQLSPITTGPQEDGYSARLSIDDGLARKISIYRNTSDGYQLVLGKDPNAPQMFKSVSEPLKWDGENLFVEAHEFPNIGFDGIFSINVSFLDENSSPSNILGTDTVLMRVSPWIMTPNTQSVKGVYVSQLDPNYQDSNKRFVDDLKAILNELQIPLHVANREGLQDRWMQDELETGYAQDATHNLPVVFDGPRNRGLDYFPETLLGPDFGHFAINGARVNSLDSFGNLEVSPPVTVDGKNYPFGRIIYGGPDRRKPMELGDRQMMGKIRAFLGAQLMQAPIELFADWLVVGHVDEFMTFIPDKNSSKGFKLLLASTKSTKEVLEHWQTKGYGGEVLFKGLERASGESAEITINDLLADNDLWEFNGYCEECISYNESLLTKELGLEKEDIIDIPVMFKPEGHGNGHSRAGAYFPDMINHLVIDNASIVGKPFGAVIDGKCIFERKLEEQLPNRKIYYIDDWYEYHEMLGEVHCGTNVVRKPFDLKWWEHKPEGSYNI